MRVVIADDDTLLRHGLATMLAGAGLDVVATVGTADAIVGTVESMAAEVLLTDIRMPPGNTDDGLRAAMEVRRRLPDVAIMVLSQFVQRRYALDLVGDQPKGVGYQLKHRVSDPDAFIEDLRRVAAGGTALDSEVVTLMLHRARSSLDRLTPRQRQVLALVAEGQSNAAIAARLHISDKAVVMHTSNIYSALDIPNSDLAHRRVLAALRYLNQ